MQLFMTKCFSICYFPLVDFQSLEIVSYNFAQFYILFLGVRICQPLHSPTARSLTQYIVLKCNHTAHPVFYTEKSNYSRFLV